MEEQTWSEEARLVTRVALYTRCWVVTGKLRARAPVRLTDLLNNLSESFFQLDEARTVNLQDGRAEGKAAPGTLLISLDEILVLHELPQPEGPAQLPGRTEMRVSKLPTPVVAYLGPLRVEGDLHLPAGADMAAHLSRAAGPFLPLTSVAVFPPGHERIGVVRVPFALVNRDHLVLGRLEGLPPSPESLA